MLPSSSVLSLFSFHSFPDLLDDLFLSYERFSILLFLLNHSTLYKCYFLFLSSLYFQFNLCLLYSCLLLHLLTSPENYTMFSSTTTTCWFNSSSTVSIFMSSRTSSTSAFSFPHFTSMSMTVETSHWFWYKLPETEPYQAKENLLWFFFWFKLFKKLHVFINHLCETNIMLILIVKWKKHDAWIVFSNLV
ncbi:hypothetical protein AMECASPLE_039686 [Ameca splendens]|uniref:Uncharacterized protein n=1 Tax=Ameca splendens TaxID=208324 RepID=A0ABV0YVL7_9TELE